LNGKRVLLHLRHGGILRHYAAVLAQLEERGHTVAVYVAKPERGSVEEAVAAILAGRIRGVSVQLDPTPRSRLERVLTARLRWLCDVLWYSHPDFENADWLRERALEGAPQGVARWAQRVARCGWPTARGAIAVALALDRLLPPPKAYEQLLEDAQPDAVLVSPGVWPGSSQVDLLKAASRRGIPTAVLVPSWDNLTNKGLLRYVPDRVFVWNEMQRDELERLHRLPPEAIAATGAPTFDRWFSAGNGDRETFCERVGLDPQRPYILYLASSRQVAPGEPVYFERWLDLVRSAEDEALRDVPVLVRPHPIAGTHAAWIASELDRREGVTIWPRDLADALASSDYYSDYAESMRHCALAVGLNSSSLVEVAIFGKAVCTWEDGDLGLRQRQTLHYRHLLRAGGGLLHVATSPDEHVAQLARLLSISVPDARSSSFVAAFVRPLGVDKPVAPIMASEIAELVRRPSRVVCPGPIGRTIGSALARVAFVLGLPLRDRPMREVAVRLAVALVVACARAAAAAAESRAATRHLLLVAVTSVARRTRAKALRRTSRHVQHAAVSGVARALAFAALARRGHSKKTQA
jgi:CDP-glycerol:poly(glycerophosphate) glycerophosphotransferase